MPCSVVLNGLANPQCFSSKGGITKAWIAVAGSFQPQLSASGDSIVSGTVTEFKPYSFRKNTGSMTSTLNVDAAAGVNYISTELNLVFSKMEVTKRLEIAALSVGDLEIIVKDANGTYYFLGYDEPVNATSGEGATGTQATDGNSYSITFTDESDSWPFMVTGESTIAALEALEVA